MRTSAFALVAAFSALAACQAPDVGAPCNLDVAPPTPVRADYMETGVAACDNLICIQSAPPPPGTKGSFDPNRPYCSKACVSDADCSQGDTGLVCRSVVLDATFLANLPPDVRQRYLGDTGQFSRYCAAPLPL
jgi:hypothetical protein